MLATAAVGAMEVLRDEPVDVVLVDIMLPGRDGNDMIRANQGRHPFRELPVVALTTKPTPTPGPGPWPRGRASSWASR